MSLNSDSSANSFSADVPSSKFSLNINAFNGNTTNFNRCPAPSKKALPFPVQPITKPTFVNLDNISSSMIRPM
jgi:hypothetical protein